MVCAERVKVDQLLLIGSKGGQVTIPLVLGGIPKIPLMDMFFSLPGRVTLGPVPGVGSVIGRL